MTRIYPVALLAGNTKKALALGLAAMMTSASLLAGVEKPAQASAFPGANGKIVFSSNQDFSSNQVVNNFALE